MGRKKNSETSLLKFQHQFCITGLDELGTKKLFGFRVAIQPMPIPFVCGNTVTEVDGSFCTTNILQNRHGETSHYFRSVLAPSVLGARGYERYCTTGQLL